MIAALKEIVAACKANGIRAGLHCGTPDYAASAIEWGFDMTMVSGDSRLLAGAAGASAAKFRQLTGQLSSISEKGAYSSFRTATGGAARKRDTRPFQTRQ